MKKETQLVFQDAFRQKVLLTYYDSALGFPDGSSGGVMAQLSLEQSFFTSITKQKDKKSWTDFR